MFAKRNYKTMRIKQEDYWYCEECCFIHL